jgi:hypothetical protein
VPGSGLTRRQLLAGAAVAGGVLCAVAGGTAWAFESSPRAARERRSRDIHHFVSEPDLKPPKVTVGHRAAGAAPGLVLISPSSGPGQHGAMIVDGTGEPVWFLPTPHRAVTNLRVAVYRGEPVLTWWEGKTEHGLGDGDHVIADASYRQIARFPAGGGLAADLHELLVTPQGTALVTAWDIRSADLSSIGGRPGYPVVEGVVQELEIPSAKVLFEWRSLDHVPVAESYAGIGQRYDYFHVNSIDVDGDGDLIVSARNTWTVYKVSRQNGNVVWRLGGKKSDFALGPGSHFSWQHDARSVGGGRYTVFDNADSPQEERQSRGLVLALDTARRQATLVRALTHSPPALSHMFGSVQSQANGNVLVGWGASQYFTEYDSAGRVVFDAALPHGGQSYRALRFPWVGRPASPPALAARHGRLFASWNGSTETAGWQVHAGGSPSTLRPAVTVHRQGFETPIVPPAGTKFASVTALDSAQRPLATSAAIPLT